MARIYSAVFPVNSKKTLDDLTGVVAEWIASSPYRKINRNEISGIAQDGFMFEKGHVTIHTVRYEGRHYEKQHDLGVQKSIGIRLVEQKQGAVRTSEVVGHIANDKFNVVFTNDYEATRTGEKYGKILKPRIVNDIIRALGGGYDGLDLEVKTTPHWIMDDDLPFVADIIRNKSENTLPVVYVSRYRQDITPVNPNDLAFLLGGIAHVIVEPSPSIPFTFNLKNATNGINAYNGAVGIYWPNGVRHHLLPKSATAPETGSLAPETGSLTPGTSAMVDEIHEIIRESALYTVVPDCSTFNGIKGLQTAKRFEDLKKSHAAKIVEIEQSKKTGADITTLEDQVKELNALLQLASDETGNRDTQIEELKRQNYGMGQQLARFQKKAGTGGEMLTVPPDMNEFYSGELRDMVIAALDNYFTNNLTDTRRADMIRAIREANQPSNTGEEILEQIQKIFKSTKPVDKVMSQLRTLGFIVDQTGEVRVTIPGSGRQVHISGTPGDLHSREIELRRIFKKLL